MQKPLRGEIDSPSPQNGMYIYIYTIIYYNIHTHTYIYIYKLSLGILVAQEKVQDEVHIKQACRGNRDDGVRNRRGRNNGCLAGISPKGQNISKQQTPDELDHRQNSKKLQNLPTFGMASSFRNWTRQRSEPVPFLPSGNSRRSQEDGPTCPGSRGICTAWRLPAPFPASNAAMETSNAPEL